MMLSIRADFFEPDKERYYFNTVLVNKLPYPILQGYGRVVYKYMEKDARCAGGLNPLRKLQYLAAWPFPA